MTHSWLPWHPASAVSCGQFAWRKSSVRTRDKKKESFIYFLGSDKCLWFLNVVYFGSALFSQCLVRSFFPSTTVSHSSQRSCGFEASGFEVWSHSCMTNTGAIAMHLYAGWRREKCLGPNGLTAYWACTLSQGLWTICETNLWLTETVLNLKPRGLLLRPGNCFFFYSCTFLITFDLTFKNLKLSLNEKT